MIAANGTIVDDNVPRPEGDRVPLLNLEAFLLKYECTIFRYL